MLTLYDYFRSSACFRVRIALNLKNLTYKTLPVHLIKDGGEQFKDNYTKLNPHALVPTLITEHGPITQSIAILDYLDQSYPEPPLLPQNTYERALIKAFAAAIVADIHPLNNLRVLKHLSDDFNISDDQKNKWYQHWVIKGLQALEQQLIQQQRSGEFCYGDSPTVADICLVPQIYNARRFNCDLSNLKRLLQIDTNCQQLPAFTNAWPVETTTCSEEVR